MSQYIIFISFLHNGGAILHCLNLIENERILLVLRFNRSYRSVCGNFVLCYYSGNIISVIPDSFSQNKSVRKVPVGRVGRPRMSRCRKFYLRNIKACYYFYNAGYFFRFGNVNGLYDSVGYRRPENLCHKKVFFGHIIRIFSSARYLIIRVNTLFTDTYSHIIHLFVIIYYIMYNIFVISYLNYTIKQDINKAANEKVIIFYIV